MNLTKKLIVALALSVGSLAANAVPAYPGLINATQPDGTTVAVKLHGDESLNWTSTPDGYTLLRNGEGFWSFARQMKDGSIEASELVYRGDESVAVANGIEKGLKYSGAQRLELKQQNLELKGSSLQVEGTYPSTGKNKLLLLLLNYSDTQPVFTQTNFDAMMNQENYGSVGCFRDYYLENSYGKLDITTTVTRWVTLPYAKEYYGSDRAIEMIQHGLNILVSNGELDLREFDNDGDGVLDGLAVIHQGAGQEYTGGANDIWSQHKEKGCRNVILQQPFQVIRDYCSTV